VWGAGRGRLPGEIPPQIYNFQNYVTVAERWSSVKHAGLVTSEHWIFVKSVCVCISTNNINYDIDLKFMKYAYVTLKITNNVAFTYYYKNHLQAHSIMCVCVGVGVCSCFDCATCPCLLFCFLSIFYFTTIDVHSNIFSSIS